MRGHKQAPRPPHKVYPICGESIEDQEHLKKFWPDHVMGDAGTSLLTHTETRSHKSAGKGKLRGAVDLDRFYERDSRSSMSGFMDLIKKGE